MITRIDVIFVLPIHVFVHKKELISASQLKGPARGIGWATIVLFHNGVCGSETNTWYCGKPQQCLESSVPTHLVEFQILLTLISSWGTNIAPCGWISIPRVCGYVCSDWFEVKYPNCPCSSRGSRWSHTHCKGQVVWCSTNATLNKSRLPELRTFASKATRTGLKIL